jgi:tripartite-type tricarboxylate transporter receptor subunit TctC
MEAYWGVVAPAATSTAIIGKLHEAIERTLKPPEILARLEEMQFQPVGSTPAEFDAFVQREVSRWLGVVKATGLKVD